MHIQRTRTKCLSLSNGVSCHGDRHTTHIINIDIWVLTGVCILVGVQMVTFTCISVLTLTAAWLTAAAERHGVAWCFFEFWSGCSIPHLSTPYPCKLIPMALSSLIIITNKLCIFLLFRIKWITYLINIHHWGHVDSWTLVPLSSSSMTMAPLT